MANGKIVLPGREFPFTLALATLVQPFFSPGGYEHVIVDIQADCDKMYLHPTPPGRGYRTGLLKIWKRMKKQPSSIASKVLPGTSTALLRWSSKIAIAWMSS